MQASEKIDESTDDISTSVEFIGEASSQLNSLMLPIIALQLESLLLYKLPLLLEEDSYNNTTKEN